MPVLGSGGSTVSGAQIVDESISNDDIAANAAISATKIDLAGQIDNAEISEAVVQIAMVSLSSNDLLNLHTTRPTLIAAPGAGKAHVLDEYVLRFIPGATPYANGGTIIPVWDNGTSSITGTQTGISSIANTLITDNNAVILKRQYGTSNIPIVENAAIKLYTDTAFINGNGTAKVWVKYRTITL